MLINKIKIKNMPNELVSHKNNHAKDITEFMHSDERFADSVQRRDFFCSLDEVEFIDILQQVASLVRTGNASSLQHFDGDTVGLTGHEVPDQREKEALLRETWQTAKSFLADSKIDDQDALDYAALTVAGGFLYVHPFSDGNGRTSRVISYMISQGFGRGNELQNALASSYGGGYWNVTPDKIIPLTPERKFSGNQPDRIVWGDADDADEWTDPGVRKEDALGGIIANSGYSDDVIRQFIEQHQGMVDDKIDVSTVVDENGKRVLDAQKFIELLVNDEESGMTDAKSLLENHRYFRAEYVHRYLNALQSKTRIEIGRTLKNYSRADILTGDFEDLRLRGLTCIRELGKRTVNGMLTPIDRQLVTHKTISEIRQVPEDR